ncbi:hypothetical protein [Bradyrhizobium ottawaense]|uniref:hypothetical protein n=1 Tax=Bradyrhizobium ottawaense TaxID=931866 RepID=UPI0012602A82|nr:hypothetical protein [Bradyrhizobium ottawaense]MBR1326066.1 hypothetical protein [Bradyrhizobium ottawaense]
MDWIILRAIHRKYRDADKEIALRAERIEMLGFTLVTMAMLFVWWRAWAILNQEWGAHDWGENLRNAAIANFVSGPLFFGSTSSRATR